MRETMARNMRLILTVVFLSHYPESVFADSFTIPGFQPQVNVLIENVKEDKDWVDVTYWKLEEDGFVGVSSLGSRKEAGREEPKVIKSSSAEKQKIIAEWQKRGVSAQVTDVEIGAKELSNVFLDYDPPAGYQWSRPAYLRETSITIVSDGKEKKINFESMAKLERLTEVLQITLTDGTVISGVHSPPEFNGKPYRSKLYGVHYEQDGRVLKTEIPFDRVSQVVFEARKVKDEK